LLFSADTADGVALGRLSSWGLAELSSSLQRIVSEIVTNAGSDVDVRLRACEDRVRPEVRDSDSDLPVRRPSRSPGRGTPCRARPWPPLRGDSCGHVKPLPERLGKTISVDVSIPGT